MTAAVANRYILPDAELLRILNDLDQAEGRQGLGRRRWPRLEYRLRGVPAVIEHPNGSKARLQVPTRNISCGGIAILTTCFLHVGTKITVALPDLRGHYRACAGTVAFCRFICGRIHEVGVMFVEQIRLEEFQMAAEELTVPAEGRTAMMQSPLSGAVVVVSEREAERVLAVNRLKQTGLSPVGVANTGACIDRVKRLGASAVVCDLSIEADDVMALLMGVSELEPLLPVVGLAYPNDPDVVRRAIQGGMMGCLTAPLALSDVHEAMQKALAMGRPFCPSDSVPDTSGGAEATEHPDMVRYFVKHCGESAERLRGAVSAHDFGAATAICKALQSTAPGYGFRSVALAAREATASLNATCSTDESADRIAALLNVLDRIAPSTAAPAAGADKKSSAAAGGAPEAEGSSAAAEGTDAGVADDGSAH